MSNVRILICDPIDPEGIEKLKKAGYNVAFLVRKEMLKKEIQECDVLIVRSRTKVTREIIESGKGIAVINTPEASADSVAELTIGLMVALARKMILADSSMKQGKWLKKELMGFLLKGKKLGLIGLGNIGLRVARIAKAMGMKILVTKRVPPSPELLKSLEAEFLPLDELLRQSDIVSIHVPLSKETRNMIDAEEIGRGAALDVYSVEPPENLELIKQPNVICTPHIGAQTVEAQKEASIRLAEKIIRFLHGLKSNSS